MTTKLEVSKTKNLDSLIIILKGDIVLSASLILAIASCFVAQPRTSYINFKVLACLFDLMIVIKAFEELHLIDKFAISILNKCTDSRKVSMILIFLSFFTSMLVTNDIALLTLVPLTLIISKKSSVNMLETIILQTLAANIGSSLTPMGNPQNLFIFSYYKLTAIQFFPPVILFAATGLIWLFLLNHRKQNVELGIALESIKIKDKMKTLLWSIIFIIIILSVFEIINFKLVFLFTVAVTLVVSKELLIKIDYLLLITFVCFFIFIGNISSISLIDNYMKGVLNSSSSTYFSSILLSQFVSNVPCSVFLSKFTTHWKELLVGANIGGMGTVVASLASVISYKLFIKEHPQSIKKYFLKFSIYNFISLAIFTLINYFIVVNR